MNILMMQKMSENTKRILVILLLVFIIIFVLVGAIATAIQSGMKKQGLKADEMMANVTKAEYFKKESKFINFGIRKNIRTFYVRARIPFMLILGAGIAYVLYCLFGGAPWGYNPFNNVDGFATILIKFGPAPKEKFFGINLISDWPPIIKPEPTIKALFSYIFVPVTIAGYLWILIETLGYIARSFRIRKIAKSIYRKKLVPEEQPTSNPVENK